MRIIGLAGWSGSGKTTLLAKVIPRLVARGKRVSTLKHAHHGFDLDQPGKDSHVHREAGATEVLIGSAKRWAIMHELRGAPEPSLRELLKTAVAGRSGGGRRLQTRAHPEARNPPRRRSASRCCIRKTTGSSRSRRTARCRRRRCRSSTSTTSQRSPTCLLAEAMPIERLDTARRTRVMAQLTDDCFAFSGPLLPVEDARADHRGAHACRSDRDRNRRRSRERAGRVLARDVARRSICRHSTIPRSTAMPCATPISLPERETTARNRRIALSPAQAAGAAPAAGEADPDFHRRADAARAPTPSSCRKMCRTRRQTT